VTEANAAPSSELPKLTKAQWRDLNALHVRGTVWAWDLAASSIAHFKKHALAEGSVVDGRTVYRITDRGRTALRTT
jgi:hypothetical protein